MSPTVAVLGAGYAGAGAVQRLESELGDDADLVWISDTDYHLVLHESHRCIRDPSVRDSITFPVEEIKAPSTTFVHSEVTGLDAEAQTIELADADDVDYDYVLVAIGSATAFYGIPGLAEHSHTLKSLDDALSIHEALVAAAKEATRSNPATVVIGGAGLSGIQTAGEVAEYRDEHDAPIDIVLVEALDEIFPGQDPSIQQALRKRLEARDIEIMTGDPITEATEEAVIFEDADDLHFDVLVWTGGISGRDALEDSGLDNEHNRLSADDTFQTSDDRVFAIGDSALVAQNGDVAPPTAQAAWQAAEVAGQNLARAIEGRSLKSWRHDDKGTVVSVGEDAVAHDVDVVPFVDTFGSVPARLLKKAIAARWIKDISSWRRAKTAWPDL
ncbi:NADH dehydrogenase, FAD-containing subunit [Salinarchaeum sp. Harcht-Bsk1]|uniref:NAD(P)/FAD-dependent oxidoreductase n=1 Tax=Salinarchaeum sp. Harcht-Bsk1 TaxID=1333523 RepID=UPI0003422EBB|nr:FAD-dependent oxidoreductase [Salinarchaeum sp. Harcht-Bsk1]AGM99964.1 NADH dehydrogenase, FAD-containing subunit [Salinarchaeum sp. Harcht-Bsk1]